MLGIVLAFIIIFILFNIGISITGAILSAILWLCVQLPVGLACIALGVALCCTILLIPFGKFFCKLGANIIAG